MGLPPRSPDPNRIKRLWLRLKTHGFSAWIAKNSPELQQRPSYVYSEVVDHILHELKECKLGLHDGLIIVPKFRDGPSG